ncbi:MAG TPA: LysR family transcriptional regulator [Polyangiaceae bacterium]|jgi:DNA-binding transcriptional LysR family regulator|nr:LysR family transcriptional regulator [Polyangiaceae bacterium]
MREPVETTELLAFTRIVEAKSLSRAAAELGVPRATIGRRLARLEERLGMRLLRRTTRSLSLTDAGDNFYRHARIVLDSIAQAEASVRMTDNVMRGDLRVSVPPISESSFLDMVISFAEKHPAVRVQIDFSTRIVDLLRDGYDVALRASAEIQPGLVARTVGRHKVIAVASPEYLAKNGTPRTVKELRKHRCLTGFARGELPQSTWPVGRGVLHVESSFSSNDLTLLRETAVRGLGIALLPRLVLADLLENGTLVHVLPGIVEAENRLAVVYPEREFLPPHVRAFIEALVEWAPALQPSKRTRAAAPSTLRHRR